jgi:hypothetical protein
MEWTELVVTRLAESKAAGASFERAWRLALEAHPPRNRDQGPAVPSLLDSEPSVVEFFRAACSDAWHGRRPELAHLDAALLDTSGTAGIAAQARTREVRLAA